MVTFPYYRNAEAARLVASRFFSRCSISLRLVSQIVKDSWLGLEDHYFLNERMYAITLSAAAPDTAFTGFILPLPSVTTLLRSASLIA